MARGEVVLPVGFSGNTKPSQGARPIITADGTQYWIGHESINNDLWWMKSTDDGVTWSQPVAVKAGAVVLYAVWFDRWNPGDTGTLVHIAYVDAGAHDVFFRTLDTSSDTLGTELTVFNGASAVGGANSCVSLTKSRAVSPRVYIAFDMDAGTETGFYKSDDYPPTAFSVKDNGINEGVSDYYHLAPGNESDLADIYAWFWDRSADELSLKVYDDSANSWSEVNVITGMVDVASTTVSSQFSLAVRPSDGHVFLVAWSNSDSANADLRIWEVTNSGSIVERTNVVLNSGDDQGACSIAIEAGTERIFVFYLGKSDGTETAYTAVNGYYKISTDGGVNWGSETKFTVIVRPLSFLTAAPNFPTADEFAVSIASTEVSTNVQLYCSAIIPSGGGGGGVVTKRAGADMRGGML